MEDRKETKDGGQKGTKRWRTERKLKMEDSKELKDGGQKGK